LSAAILAVAVHELKAAGATRLHIRIPSPPIIHQCTGRVLPTTPLVYDRLNTRRALREPND
jgi:hypothetical protein